MDTAIRMWAAVTAFLILVSVTAAAEFSPYPGDDVEPLAPPIETPHVKWAKPYAGGKIKALFLLFYDYQRDALEMASRLDLDYSVLAFGPGKDEGLAEGDLVRLLKEKSYDVIVSAHFPLWILSDEAKSLLREKVAQGAGLVYIPPNQHAEVKPIEEWLGKFEWHSGEAPEFCTRGVPLGALPTKSTHIEGWGILGKGRVLLVNYYPMMRGIMWWQYLIPDPEAHRAAGRDLLLWYPHWEYYFAAMARNIVWASRKEVSVGIELPQEMKISRDLGGEVVASITSDREQPARLTWTIRDEFYRVASTGEKEMRLQAGKSEAKILLPTNLIHGLQFLDVILFDSDGKALDWASTIIRVEAPAWIEKVEAAKDLFEVDEPIRLRYEIGGEKGQAVCEILLQDAYDRLVYRGKVAEGQVEIPPIKPLSTYHVASVRLLRGEDLLSEVRTPVYVRNTARFFDRFFIASFVDCQPTYSATFFNQFIRKEMLFDSVVATPSKSDTWYRHVSASGMDILPEHVGFVGGDPNDVLAEEARLERIKRFVHDIRKYGVPAYASTEELNLEGYAVNYVDLTKSEPTRAAFREFLKRKYGDVPTAAKAWGKEYTAWDAFLPISVDDSRRENLPTAWKDYCDFADETWKQYLVTRFAQAVKQGDEKAVGGYNASLLDPSPLSGYNWPLMFSAAEFTIEYPMSQERRLYDGIKDEVLRSFMQGTLAFYLGYQRNPKILNYQTWYLSLHGAHGLVNFIPIAMDVGRTNWSYIHPTLAPTQRTLWWRDAVRELAGGIGRIFIESRRENDAIALLYSHDSLQRLYFDGNAGLLNMSLNHFQDLLESLALQYEYVDERRIEEGVLKDFRVVILPMTVALNEKTLQALKSFVEEGGTIIADLGTGLYGADLKPRGNDWFLKEVFGISVVSPELQLAKCPPVKSKGGWLGSEFSGLTFSADGRSSLRLTGGVEAAAHDDGTPALVMKVAGKGRAIYFNFVPALEEQTYRLLEKILRRAGVKPPVRLLSDSGRVTDVECVQFTGGDGEVLALQRKMGGPQGSDEFRVILPQPFHIYDMRKRSYLGKTQEIPLKLAEGETAVFAFLPYEVQELAIAPRKMSVIAGEPVEFDVTLKLSGDGKVCHVVRIEVEGPSGPLHHYDAQLVLKDGKCTHSIPIALNDTPGSWKLRATDVISGKAAEANFEVK